MRVLLLVFLMIPTLSAQAIESARILERNGSLQIVEISFTMEFESGDLSLAKMTGNYSVFDSTAGVPVPIHTVADIDEGVVELRAGPMDPSHSYHVFVRNLTFAGKVLPKPLQAQAKPATGMLSSRWSTSKAKSRKKASIHIDGSLQRSSGGDLIGSADIRVAIPFFLKRNSARHLLSPIFDLRWSNDPKADPDTLSAGAEYRYNLGQGLDLRRPFSTSFFYFTPKLESDRSFGNTNWITEASWLIFSQDLAPKGRIVIEPFVGIEAGKNLKSPVAEADGRALARPFFRAELTAPLVNREEDPRRVAIEANWQRRWPLTNEVFFEKGDDQTLLPVRFGKGPKDWVEAKLTIGFAKFFDVVFGYKYGQLPPKYKFVDHQFSLGVRYSVALSPKSSR